MASRTERILIRTEAILASTEGTHRDREGIHRSTGPIHPGSEATYAMAARSERCPGPMRRSRARIHGRNVESVRAIARTQSGTGAIEAHSARTAASRAEFNPSTGQMSGAHARIDRDTGAMNHRIAGIFIVLA